MNSPAAPNRERQLDQVDQGRSSPHDEQRSTIPAVRRERRHWPNVCADDLAASRDFYVALLGFQVNHDSDWYVQLRSPNVPGVEFGLIKRTHDLVPKTFQTAPSGVYVTFVVPDVEASYSKALDLGARIVQPPRNEFYGQRRFPMLDPSGCLLDICSPWSEEEA